MLGPRRVEGFVIASSDGMIAAADGEMPSAIRNDADQEFFQAALDRVAVVVHGRHSCEGGPHAAARKRIILTRRTAEIARDPQHPNAVLWNPNGAPLEAAIAALGAGSGTVAIIGGTEVFSLFLPFYDAFHLSRAARAKIPGGLPVFDEVGPCATPEDVLARHGLEPGSRRVLDAAACVTVVTWERHANFGAASSGTPFSSVSVRQRKT
jgi:dihydrofolate reductase